MGLLRWAGGKGRLLPILRGRLPSDFRVYHEPFVGGGALFCELSPMGAILSDGNAELINLYQAIKHRPAALLERYREFPLDAATFYALRAVERTDAFRRWSPLDRAARYLYLNRAGFNGGMRVNARGELSVSYGHPPARRMEVAAEVWAWHARLRQTRLWHAGFERAEAAVGPGDFVYFDPPYLPVGGRRPVRYTRDGFGCEAQARLAQICGRLHRKGAYFMLSNADVPWIERLFNGYRIERLSVYRSLAGVPGRRRHEGEVLVTNYD